jgi:hypothetical protein
MVGVKEAGFVAGIPGRAAVTENVQAPLGMHAPSVELPAPATELAAAAVERLGWGGVALPPTTVLGRRVVLVAELLPDAHAERICLGIRPETDRATVATWVWPEFAGRVPTPATRIVGVIAVAKHWRTGLASVAPFSRYGDTAVVLPSSVILTSDYLANCLPRARTFGVAVVSADPDSRVDVDLPTRSERTLAAEDATMRWVSEVAYAQFLDDSAN